jgi:hypothetical protein
MYSFGSKAMKIWQKPFLVVIVALSAVACDNLANGDRNLLTSAGTGEPTLPVDPTPTEPVVPTPVVPTPVDPTIPTPATNTPAAGDKMTISIDDSLINLNLSNRKQVVLTLTGLAGFNEDVTVSVTGLAIESGTVTPTSTVTIPASGGVTVDLEFVSASDSLATTAAMPLEVEVMDMGGAPVVTNNLELGYELNNLLEISLDDGSGTTSATHRWSGMPGNQTINIRSGTGIIWTNFDTTATHRLHGNAGITHGPGGAMGASAQAGLRGESYGGNAIHAALAQIQPMIMTQNGNFYCHDHQADAVTNNVVISTILVAQKGTSSRTNLAVDSHSPEHN